MIDTKQYSNASDITAYYGKRYFFATRFLSESKRQAIHTLYAFFRIADEIVDSQSVNSIQTYEDLKQWTKQWNHLQTTDPDENTHPTLKDMWKLCQDYDIAYEYTNAFLEAMERDLTHQRYERYQDLKEYMYGSAEVVGIMCAKIIGYHGDALPYAQKLGEAMQMTNFLRDINEDFQERNRIYIPQKDLRYFEINEDVIRHKVCNDQFQTLMKYYIEKTRDLYSQAYPGIELLHPDGQRGVKIAFYLYRSILNQIEHLEYDIFRDTIKPNTYQKVLAVYRSFRT